jgi:hypothetical protein
MLIYAATNINLSGLGKKFSELVDILEVRHKKYAILAFFANKSSSPIICTLLLLRLGISRSNSNARIIASWHPGFMV